MSSSILNYNWQHKLSIICKQTNIRYKFISTFLRCSISNNYIASNKYSGNLTLKENEKLTHNERTTLLNWIEIYAHLNYHKIPQVTEFQLETLNRLSEKGKVALLKKLVIVEKVDLDRIARKAAKKIERNINANKQHIDYRLWNNSMFGKTYESSIKEYYQLRAFTGLRFGHPIVIDCSFDQNMKKMEMVHFCQHILEINRRNSRFFNPFAIYLCNVARDSLLLSELFNKNTPSYSPNYSCNISSKSFIELFPNEQITYLTPDARETMDCFNPDTVYILGGIVDLNSNLDTTAEWCRKHRIKTMKLPLNKYVVCRGRKELPIYSVVSILQELQNTGKWEKALRKLPNRVLERFIFKSNNTS